MHITVTVTFSLSIQYQFEMYTYTSFLVISTCFACVECRTFIRIDPLNNPWTKIQTQCFISDTTIKENYRNSYNATWSVIYNINQTTNTSGTLTMSYSSYDDAFNATQIQYQVLLLLLPKKSIRNLYSSF